MNKGKLIFLLILVLIITVSGCLNRTQLPQKEIFDCKEDESCFSKYLETCSPTKSSKYGIDEPFEYNTLTQIIGPKKDKCIIKSEVNFRQTRAVAGIGFVSNKTSRKGFICKVPLSDPTNYFQEIKEGKINEYCELNKEIESIQEFSSDIKQYFDIFDLSQSEFRLAYKNFEGKYLLFLKDGIILNSIGALDMVSFIPYNNIDKITKEFCNKSLLLEEGYIIKLVTEVKKEGTKIVNGKTKEPSNSEELDFVKEFIEVGEGIIMLDTIKDDVILSKIENSFKENNIEIQELDCFINRLISG